MANDNIDIVKCSSCNIVINELLTFVRHVIDYTDEESIHQLCTTTFSEEDIAKAKVLLFESVSCAKKMPLRKKQGKKRMSRDLDDIIGLMKGTDPSKFPIFCARNLDRIPPVTYDHVDATRFIKEILAVKNRLTVLEEKAVTVKDFDLLKQEVSHMKNASFVEDFQYKVNSRRGACLQSSFDTNSGPFGLNYVPEYVAINSAQTADAEVNVQHSVKLKVDKEIVLDDSISLGCTQKEATNVSQSQPQHLETSTVVSNRESTISCDDTSASGTESACAQVIEMQQNATECGDSAGVSETVNMMTQGEESTDVANTSREKCVRVSLVNRSPTIENRSEASKLSARSIHKGETRSEMRNHSAVSVSAISEQTVGVGEWQVVRSKSSKHYKLVGQKGCAPNVPNGKFKAAEVKIPLLISNVSKEASEEDIIKYIKDKTNESVTLKKINMLKNKNYYSYKLFVSKNNLDTFLSDEFWPKGVTFRRFVHFMYKTKAKTVNSNS